MLLNVLCVVTSSNPRNLAGSLVSGLCVLQGEGLVKHQTGPLLDCVYPSLRESFPTLGADNTVVWLFSLLWECHIAWLLCRECQEASAAPGWVQWRSSEAGNPGPSPSAGGAPWAAPGLF